MSWRRSKGSVILRDTSRDRQGYKRSIRTLTRKSTFGKSFRIDAEGPKPTPVVEKPKQRFSDRCGNVYRKLQYNRTYRIRVTYSLCLVWIYMFLGWTTGQLGPILLDLSLITGVSLEATATYIIIIGVGYILGSFLGGMVYERLSRPLTLFFACVALAVLEFSIPYCRMYWLMMIVLFLDGACEGLIDTVANTEMVSLWGRSINSWMQGMYFMFAVGAVISPLVTAPFLAPEITLTVSESQYSSASGAIFTLYHGAQSRIYQVYIINACLALVGAALFFYQCIRNSIFLHGLSLPISDVNQTKPLTTREKVLVLSNMGLLCFLYTAIEETFAEYLTIFCVTQLGMTKLEGAEATSIFFAAFGLSRFIGIFLVTQLNPVRLVCFYCIILIMSFVGLTLSGLYYHTVGIWLFTPLVGIGLSIIYPILYTWTDENFVHINGKITAYLIIMASIGGMINPALLGYLMEDRTPMWFCYLLLVESLLFLLFYDVGLVLSRWLSSKPNVRRLYNSEVELDTIKENFGLDQRCEPSIGSFDRMSPAPLEDNTGLKATKRLSSVQSSRTSSEKQKMDTITEGKTGPAGGIVTTDEKISASKQEDASTERSEGDSATSSRVEPTNTKTNEDTSTGMAVSTEGGNLQLSSDTTKDLEIEQQTPDVLATTNKPDPDVVGAVSTDNSEQANAVDTASDKMETIV